MSHRQHQHDPNLKAQSLLSENGSQVQTQDPVLLALLAKRSSQRHSSHQHHSERTKRGDRTGGMNRSPPMHDKKTEEKMREALQPRLQQPAHFSSDHTRPGPGSKPRALFKPRSSHVHEVNLPQAEQVHPVKVSIPSGRDIQREQNFNTSALNPVKKPQGDRERVVSSTLPHSHSPQQEKKYAHHMVKSWVKQQKLRFVYAHIFTVIFFLCLERVLKTLTCPVATKIVVPPRLLFLKTKLLTSSSQPGLITHLLYSTIHSLPPLLHLFPINFLHLMHTSIAI